MPAKLLTLQYCTCLTVLLAVTPALAQQQEQELAELQQQIQLTERQLKQQQQQLEQALKAYLTHMAASPELLVKWQALLAKRAPQMLFRMLFASAQGQDRELVKSPDFRALICQVLQQCFAQGASGYTRDIQQYLKPWSASIFASEANICLWHGTADNWSPFAMSAYLAERFSRKARLERMERLSHYSCLYTAAPIICARIASP